MTDYPSNRTLCAMINTIRQYFRLLFIIYTNDIRYHDDCDFLHPIGIKSVSDSNILSAVTRINNTQKKIKLPKNY